MRRLAWYVAGAVFLAALGALVASRTVELWPLFLVSAALGVFGWAVETPSLRERIPLLHTAAMRFRVLYAGGSGLRGELGKMRRGKPDVLSREELVGRVVTWDARFWAFMHRDFLAREPSVRRSQPAFDLAERYNDPTWASLAIIVMDKRLNLLDTLLPDLKD